MPILKSNTAVAILVLAVALAGSTSAQAISDWKNIAASSCQPYGPNTTVGELTYNQLGITNPGVTNESVLCPITTDGDNAWSSTAGTSAVIYVYFRTGAAIGRVVCTVFVSNAAMVSGPTYSVTSSLPDVAANTKAFAFLNLADISGGWTISPTTVALCTITPKTTLAGFLFRESVITNAP